MSEFEDIFNRDYNKESKKEAADKWVRLRRERELNDLAWILSDERGRRFIWRMFGMCNVFSSIFCGDALQDARNNGMRTIGSIFQKDIVEVGGFKILDTMNSEDKILREKEKDFTGG
jgi:hypothetical protein